MICPRPACTYHEIAFSEAELLRQALFLCIPGSPLYLVVVVVQACNIDSGKLGNLPSRSTNTTSDIQHVHALPQAHFVRQVVFMPGYGLMEVFAIRKPAEMERCTPAILVEVGCEVIVTAIWQSATPLLDNHCQQ